MDTLTNLIALVAEHAVVEPSQISPVHTLRSLGLDSLDCIELISEIEDLFEVEFTDPLPSPDMTIGELHTLIQAAIPA